MSRKEYEELDLGIDYSDAPSLKSYKPNIARFDFSGFEPDGDGGLTKVTRVSIKPASAQSETQGSATIPPARRK